MDKNTCRKCGHKVSLGAGKSMNRRRVGDGWVHYDCTPGAPAKKLGRDEDRAAARIARLRGDVL